MAIPGGNIQALTAMQEAGGGIEAWAVDANGRIWHITQSGPGGDLMDWQGPGEQPAPAARLAATRRNDDGSEMLAMLDVNSLVSTLWRKPDGSWDPWSAPGVGGEEFAFETIAAAPHAGGYGFQLWASDLGNHIWTLTQDASGAWGEWQGPPFADQPVGMDRLAAAAARDGRVTLFGRDSGDGIWALGQSAPGTWGGWSGPNLGGAHQSVEIAAAQQGGGGGLQLFALDGDGHVATLRQASPAGDWGGWDGTPFQGHQGRFGHLAAASREDGTLMVLAGAGDGSLWTLSQNEPNSDNWGTWTQSPGPGGS